MSTTVRRLERGFASLITLAIYAAIAAAVIGGAALVWNQYVKQPYVAEGVAQEQPKTAAAIAERDQALARAKAAEDANVSLQADVTDLQTRVANQNAAIRKLQARVAQLTARTSSLVEEMRAVLLAGQVQVDALTQMALGPPVEDACKEADRIAGELMEFLRK